MDRLCMQHIAHISRIFGRVFRFLAIQSVVFSFFSSAQFIDFAQKRNKTRKTFQHYIQIRRKNISRREVTFCHHFFLWFPSVAFFFFFVLPPSYLLVHLERRLFFLLEAMISYLWVSFSTVFSTFLVRCRAFIYFFDGFWWILMSFDGFWWVLMGFDEFWWVLFVTNLTSIEMIRMISYWMSDFLARAHRNVCGMHLIKIPLSFCGKYNVYQQKGVAVVVFVDAYTAEIQLAEKLVEEPDSAPSQYLITQAPANTFNQSNIGWAESSSSTSFSASCSCRLCCAHTQSISHLSPLEIYSVMLLWGN